MASPQIEGGYVRVSCELFDAECKVKMSGSEWQVYRSIQRQTYGWNRKEAQVSMSFLAEATGISRPRVAEAIKSLIARNMLLRKSVTGGGNVFEIQKDYSKWGVVRKSVTVRGCYAKAEQGGTQKRNRSVTQKRTQVLRKSVPHIKTVIDKKDKRAKTKTLTGKTGVTQKRTTTTETWTAYALAYFERYGTDPIRNATVNSQLKQFVQRVGEAEAPSIAAYYIEIDSRWYVQKVHPVGSMLADAEAIRTQWATNRKVTATAARQSDRTSHNASVVAEVQEKLRGGA